MFLRHQTRAVSVGPLTIGRGSPISVQSMTNVFTRDTDACLEQITQLTEAGADLIRLAVPTPEDTAALGSIVKQSPIPVIADVHFHFDRALEAVAAGVAKIRLNPGNISDRSKVQRVIRTCADHGVAIRIGVNSGSVRARSGQTKQADLARPLPELMVEKIASYLDIFDACNFDQIVLSAKCSQVDQTVEVYRALARRFDFPLHLGFTAAGPLETGLVKNSLALGLLLNEGLGDTIRISLTADPVQEALAAKEILYNLNLLPRTTPELISCPTCGRCRVDLTALVQQARSRLSTVKSPVRVAIMGCEVNGPGEAAETDYALCLGPSKAQLYHQGKIIKTCSFQTMLDDLLNLISRQSR